MKLALRLAVSAALLAVVVLHLGLQNLTERLRHPDPAWTAAAFALVLMAITLSAWKWGLILRHRGITLPFSRLTRHYLVGLLFNNVLPGSVGGDAVRAWETSRDTGQVAEAIASVLSERLIAGAALGVTALLGLPFVNPDNRLVGLALAFLATDLALVGLLLLPRVAERAVVPLIPKKLQGLRRLVGTTVSVVRATLRTPRLCLRVALASIAFQILVAAVNACIFRALGTPVSLAHCIVLTPMIFTLTMLPVSVSGFGVRELAYAYFFGQVGVDQADAVAASLAFFLVVGMASLPGALLFAMGRRQPCGDEVAPTPSLPSQGSS